MEKIEMETIEPAASQTTSTSPPAAPVGMKAGRAVLITFIFYAVQFLLTFRIFFFAIIINGITLGTFTPESVAQLQQNLIVPVACVTSLSAGLVGYAVTRRTFSRSLRSGGLRPIGWSPASAPAMSLAAILGVILSLLYVFVLARLHPMPPQRVGPLAAVVAMGGWRRACWAVLVIAVAPPVEEFVFRGVLLSGLHRRIGIILTGFVVTVVFAVGHVTEALGYWPAWVSIAFLCVLTIIARVRYESLLPPLVLHATYNACLVLMVYLGAV